MEGCPPFLQSEDNYVEERHYENIKILETVGIDAYKEGLEHKSDLYQESK